MVSSGQEYELLQRTSGSANQPPKSSEEMNQIFRIVRENLMKAYMRYSKPYNTRSNEKHKFRKGDIVYKKNIHLSDKSKHFVGKLATKFTKVRIRDVLGTNCYQLEHLDGQPIKGTYHGSFLKKS